jgi:poly-gamma-glutamate synthesis protein (capsule biosynthesis protein)
MVKIQEFKNSYDFLVIFLHAGHEFTSTPSPRIRAACRGLIDAGADAVIAHHPHVIQGIEKYRQGLISYSLGNLVFDTPYVSAYKNTDLGYLLRIGISKHKIMEAEIIPYKMRDSATVTSLNGEEFEDFSVKFHELSRNITDDQLFHKEWENNVRFRWASEYKRIMNDFSKNFNDPENKDYARRARNLFTCPSHVEMLEKAFLMLEGGKISRYQVGP